MAVVAVHLVLAGVYFVGERYRLVRLVVLLHANPHQEAVQGLQEPQNQNDGGKRHEALIADQKFGEAVQIFAQVGGLLAVYLLQGVPDAEQQHHKQGQERRQND